MAAGCAPTTTLKQWATSPWCQHVVFCTANLAQFDQPVELPIGAELTRNKGAKGGSWAGGPQMACCGMFPAALAHLVLACPQLVGGHLPRPTRRLPQPCTAVVIELQSGGLFGGDTIGTVQVRSPWLDSLHSRLSPAPFYRFQLHLLWLPLAGSSAAPKPSPPAAAKQVPLGDLMQQRHMHQEFRLEGADSGRVELELQWKPYFG